MNDCPNAEIRDQLPDLLHERLDAHARALVLTHVQGCPDCRDELVLLRQLNATLMRDTPRVDVARIVSALPSPAAARRRRTWVDWRIAAAITVIAAGGGSALVLSRGHDVAPVDSARVAPVAIARPHADSAAPVVAVTTPRPAVSGKRANPRQTVASRTRAADGLDMTAHLADLSDSQLRALLGEISSMEALPMAEPDADVVPITTRGSTSDERGLE